MAKTSHPLLDALIQNYQFKYEKPGKLPTIDYVYPEYTVNGLTEEFRFSSNLRRELRERASIVKEDLHDKRVIYTLDEALLVEIDPLVPRLELKNQIEKGNAIYTYAPLLLVGANDKQFSAYIVKPIITAEMAWFELTTEETKKIQENLNKKQEEKPYRTLVQRLIGS